MKTKITRYGLAAGFALVAAAAMPALAQDTPASSSQMPSQSEPATPAQDQNTAGQSRDAQTPPPAPDASPKADANGRPDRGSGILKWLDKDSSGGISAEELSKITTDKFDQADSNGDGTITAGELADAMLRQRLMERAEKMISMFDTNGDGKLSKEEMNDREQKMFAFADRNNSGQLEPDELRSLFRIMHDTMGGGRDEDMRRGPSRWHDGSRGRDMRDRGMDGYGRDRDRMDRGGRDHGWRDHHGMDRNWMDHPGMDRGEMDRGEMNRDGMDRRHSGPYGMDRRGDGRWDHGHGRRHGQWDQRDSSGPEGNCGMDGGPSKSDARPMDDGRSDEGVNSNI